LAYLEGHFEAAPVVPGIAQIKWVAGAIRQYFGHELQLAGMEAVKFHQLLLPAQSFSLFIEADPARAKWRFQIEGERGKIASGRLLDRSPIKLEE
jgi:3-hydroxymyristoyl/3-hydroxydecanoyl-(acyl carrier protein) dehydratase